MPEEILYCPSCSHKLRVPEELLGQIVQCPVCRLVFTAPIRGGTAPRRLPPQPAMPSPPSPAPPPETPPAQPPSPPPLAEGRPLAAPADDAEREGMEQPVLDPAVAVLRVPALALLVTGILVLILAIRALIVVTLREEEFLEQMSEVQRLYASIGLHVPMDRDMWRLGSLIGSCFIGVVSVVTVFAAIQMLRLRMYWLAVTGSVVSMLNCAVPCCLLTLPLSIWALVLLLRADVRDAFS
jgi:hypothetical protein